MHAYGSLVRLWSQRSLCVSVCYSFPHPWYISRISHPTHPVCGALSLCLLLVFYFILVFVVVVFLLLLLLLCGFLFSASWPAGSASMTGLA